MKRLLLPLALLLSAAHGDPVDTAYDVLNAIEWRDGYAMQGLLSEDLYSTLSGFLGQVRALAEADPVLAENLLNQRYGERISMEDLMNLGDQELLGLMLGEIFLLPADQVERESAQLEGRNATVTLFWPGGGSVSFSMVWENGDWRVTGSSILSALFR